MARRVGITEISKRPRNIKPKKARRIIRKFHNLIKKQNTATNKEERKALGREIDELGGLDMYQTASLSGQSSIRGGDSSRILVEWLTEPIKLMLEVGCLSVDNACSRSTSISHIDRIDLNPQHQQIKKQDFMTMKPSLYNLLSLSLVVNYVPDARLRGRMLWRTREFLHDGGLLFLVLPEACVSHSRYFNRDFFDEILTSLGYSLVHEKRTNRLAYWLLRKNHYAPHTPIAKRLINDKPGLNNFTILLD